MVNYVVAGMSTWTHGVLQSWSQSHVSRKHLPSTPKMMAIVLIVLIPTTMRTCTNMLHCYNSLIYLFSALKISKKTLILNPEDFSIHSSSHWSLFPLLLFFSLFFSSLLDGNKGMTLLPADLNPALSTDLSMNYMLYVLHMFIPRVLCK